MSITSQGVERQASRWLRWPVILAVVFLVVVAFLAGARRPHVAVHTGMCLSAHPTISCEADGTTFWIPSNVRWVDTSGREHLTGRPDCLPPTGIGTEGPVRFGTVDVHSESGSRWSQVVWVTCLN